MNESKIILDFWHGVGAYIWHYTLWIMQLKVCCIIREEKEPSLRKQHSISIALLVLLLHCPSYMDYTSPFCQHLDKLGFMILLG